MRWSRAYTSTAPANSAALATGLPGPPSAAAKTKSVVAGSTASRVTPTRKAAQSATYATTQIAAADTTQRQFKHVIDEVGIEGRVTHQEPEEHRAIEQIEGDIDVEAV